MNKNDRILIVEHAKDLPRGYQKAYDRIYVYSGKAPGTLVIAADMADQIILHQGYYEAGQILDQIYTSYVSTAQASALTEVTKDEHAFLVIKRNILLALSDICISMVLVKRFLAEEKIEGEVDFIPKNFDYSLFQKFQKLPYAVPENVRVHEGYMTKMKRREGLRNLIYRWALSLYPKVLFLRMIFNFSKQKVKKKYRYGVHVWNSWISSNPSSSKMAILESEEGVRPDNALYIADGNLSKVNAEKLKDNGYDVCIFSEMLSQFPATQYAKAVSPKISVLGRKIREQCDQKALLTEAYLKFLRGAIQWEVFYQLYDVDIFLNIQEPSNNWRSLFQKQKGSYSVFIYTSIMFDPYYRKDMNTSGDIISLLSYDLSLSTKMANDHLQKSNNRIKRYIDVGSVRSDTVFQTRNDEQKKKSLKQKFNVPEDKTTIGFFDTAITSGCYRGCFNVDEGVALIDDMTALLESNENYFFIFKSRCYHNHLKIAQIKDKFEAFVKHPRVAFIDRMDAKIRAYELMGVCDLCIGCFTGSTPQESVCGGVKTICYTPQRFNHQELILNAFPNFCAHNREELFQLTDYWLNQSADQEFKDFQENFVKKYIDGYCDGQATKRLHHYLMNFEQTVSEESPDKGECVYA